MNVLGRTIVATLPLFFLLAACTKDDSAQTELKILRPASGGELVLVPGGRFTMGDAKGRPDAAPHEVHVSSFYMDRYPVTQRLYEKVMGANPSKRKHENNPVERTQWTDAAQFCNRCSELEGLMPCYDPLTWKCNFDADGYRLPTEAEWEYACRAGSEAKYFFGDDEAILRKYAWCKPHSGGRPRPVGTKLPNQWGLHDMHGNVWQWCNDYYSESYYAESPRENPRGPATGKKRVLRGGAWNATAEKCAAAYRFKEFPVYSDTCFGADSYGFRRVRSTEIVRREKQPPVPVSGGEAPGDKKPTVSASPPPAVQSGMIDRSRLTGTIIFVSDRGGALDIWRMRASGKDLTQLTHDPHADADPRFSPDGERITYTSLRGGFPEVWMMQRDGSTPKRVTQGSQAAWSPDGSAIVFIRDDQAHVREFASSRERRVTPTTWERCGVPAWSPDGQEVAVASRHLGDIGIFILSVDGKRYDQPATEDPSCTPQWSSDGKRIVFQTVKGHIHQIHTEGGSEEQLTFGADIQHDPRYSPDGSMIIFCRAPTPEGPWQLCIADLESDDLVFVQITSEGSNRLPDWHPSE